VSIRCRKDVIGIDAAVLLEILERYAETRLEFGANVFQDERLQFFIDTLNRSVRILANVREDAVVRPARCFS